jgi:hypothetical protein
MADTKANDGLKYIGDGTQLGYVPTRDLTPDEVNEFGKAYLLRSGLYAEIKVFTPKPVKSAVKNAVIAEE